MTSWMEMSWLSFDTETTGVAETDLILSAALIETHPAGAAPQDGPTYMLLNWEVDIPPESAKVHGLTREMIDQDGVDPAWGLEQICQRIAGHLTNGHPVVGMNVTFDLTMLDRCCRRAGVPPPEDWHPLVPILDALVLDKYTDPFRKGKRNLEALAKHHRVPWQGEAHNAAADARAAAGVVWRIGRVFPQLGAMDPQEIHQLQVVAKRDQDESFRRYLLDNNRDPTGVDGQWPIRPCVEVPA